MAGRGNSFVIWLDPPSAERRGGGSWAGQIEHVRSSQRTRFESGEDLLRFLVDHSRSDDGAGDDPPEPR
jgi:hypothetical protein